MFWLARAALSLLTLLILVGTVWLFWGDDLRRLGVEKKIKDTTKEKINEKAKQTAKEAPKKIKKEIQTLKKDLSESTITIQAQDEWKKAQSGLSGIVAVERKNNTALSVQLAQKNDERWHSILRRAPQNAPVAIPVRPPVKKESKDSVRRR
ncbi:MAG TPA: hypothetical protein PLY93_10830 [Turneriella sp.]|nr:hypothetical protein [Turneriella sp.]